MPWCCGDLFWASIKQPEHPQGDLVSKAHLGFVDGQIAVGDVLDLVEAFLAPAHFKEVLPVNKEITLGWIGYLMRLAQLIEEEQLTQCANVGLH